ncbi:MAG: TrlF family AAA-like ATPase [Thermodesulfobacteriota bacterium]
MNRGHGFQGMRWHKCDLHLHTPADRKHWRGQPLGTNLAETAEAYIRQCYEARLEVIAITDHNFAAKAFLPHLQRAAESLAPQYDDRRITLFPGFEITANVGKGMHVLALFEPGTDLEKIDHTLTLCGVPMPRSKGDGSHEPSTEGLAHIIKTVQTKDAQGRLEGVVICPHPHETGIFDNERISEWLQQEEWKHPDLLAIEVPKPLGQLSQGWQRLFGNGDGCQPEWQRRRPMAAVMSSDAKALTADEDPVNFIGRRSCWIRMSAPSLEALRQAFLDPESRICLEPEPPRVTHTHLASIQVQGTAFLKDQELALSPHLNCLIGGRGSGKSMLLESMRLGLRADMAVRNLSDTEHVAAKQIRRLRGTFGAGTRVALRVVHDDLEDIFLVDGSGQPARIEGRDLADPPTVFRRLGALVFSQEEISQLADRQRSLLDFVDGLAGETLEPVRAKARQLVDRLRASQLGQATIRRLEGELLVLAQEAEELSRQLAAKAHVQDDLRAHRAAQDARRYLTGVQAKAGETRERLTTLAAELEGEPPPLGSRVAQFPIPDYFRQAEGTIAAAYQGLAAALTTATTAFATRIEAATSAHSRMGAVQQAIDQAAAAFHAACGAKGLSPEEAERLRETEQSYRQKQAAREAKQSERDQALRSQPDSRQLLRELAACWRHETRIRQQLLDDITRSEAMPRTRDGAATVKTRLVFAGDREGFLKAWGGLAPDRRTAAGRSWDRYVRDSRGGNLGDQLFDVLQQSLPDGGNGVQAGNPVQWLEANWDNEAAWPDLAREYRKEIARIRDEQPERWLDQLVTRVPDAADLELLRHDGTVAGSFGNGDLSDGQKNTAILALLLACGQGPVLLDQPEDELDSAFLFHELVPMLRKAKRSRQLIVVTHNANIPVNADAELVYALAAIEGRGTCLTQGGLDRPEVAQVVLEIMEGSREAFQRRKDKYHF